MATRPTPFARPLAALVALALLASVPMSAIAGTADSPEIVDGAGDASPSTALTLQAETGRNRASAVMDLVKTYVAGENRDSFAIVFELDDLPDDWQIGQGSPGSPIAGAPGSLGAQWNDATFDSQVQLEAFFDINTRSYRVVVNLAEVRINNPNNIQAYLTGVRDEALTTADTNLDAVHDFLLSVPVHDDQVDQALAVLNQARHDITDLLGQDPSGVLANATAAVLAQVAFVNQTLHNPPQIPADVNESLAEAQQALARAIQTLTDNATALQRQIEEAAEPFLTQANDTIEALKAIATGIMEGDPQILVNQQINETRDQLEGLPVLGLARGLEDVAVNEIEKALAFLQFASDTLLGDNSPDLPSSVPPIPTGGLGLAAATPAATPLENVDAARQTLEGMVAWAMNVAPPELSKPEFATPLPPSVLVFQKYALNATSGNHPLAGALDLRNDIVQVQVPKDKVGAPAKGDGLVRFRSQSTIRSEVADYAPDARAVGAGTSQGELVEAVTGGGLLEPTFGRDYIFSYTPPPRNDGNGGGNGGGGDDDPPAIPFRIAAVGEQAAAIEEGGSVTYAVQIANTGTAPSRGLVYLNTAAPGWTHMVSQPGWQVAPGETATITVSVSAIGGGADTLVSRLILAPEGGESQVQEFRTTLESASTQTDGAAGGSGLLLWGGLAAAIAGVGACVTGVVWFVRRRA